MFGEFHLCVSQVQISTLSPVGVWKCNIISSLIAHPDVINEFKCSEDTYILFNPWCKGRLHRSVNLLQIRKLSFIFYFVCAYCFKFFQYLLLCNLLFKFTCILCRINYNYWPKNGGKLLRLISRVLLLIIFYLNLIIFKSYDCSLPKLWNSA